MPVDYSVLGLTHSYLLIRGGPFSAPLSGVAFGCLGWPCSSWGVSTAPHFLPLNIAYMEQLGIKGAYSFLGVLVACFARGSRRKMDFFALVREQQVAFLLACGQCLGGLQSRPCEHVLLLLPAKGQRQQWWPCSRYRRAASPAKRCSGGKVKHPPLSLHPPRCLARGAALLPALWKGASSP